MCTNCTHTWIERPYSLLFCRGYTAICLGNTLQAVLAACRSAVQGSIYHPWSLTWHRPGEITPNATWLFHMSNRVGVPQGSSLKLYHLPRLGGMSFLLPAPVFWNGLHSDIWLVTATVAFTKAVKISSGVRVRMTGVLIWRMTRNCQFLITANTARVLDAQEGGYLLSWEFRIWGFEQWWRSG